MSTIKAVRFNIPAAIGGVTKDFFREGPLFGWVGKELERHAQHGFLPTEASQGVKHHLPHRMPISGMIDGAGGPRAIYARALTPSQVKALIERPGTLDASGAENIIPVRDEVDLYLAFLSWYPRRRWWGMKILVPHHAFPCEESSVLFLSEQAPFILPSK